MSYSLATFYPIKLLRILLGCAAIICHSTSLYADQTTPLTHAIRLEKFDEAQKHITSDLVNKADDGKYHPITYASFTGNNELIKSLLKAGADPSVVEHNGKSPLYVAANFANIEGIKLLHKHGAKVPPIDALSPAMGAVYSGSLDTLKTLVGLYPDLDLKAGWGEEQLKTTQGFIKDPVTYATYLGYNDMALYLLEKKVPAIDKNGMGMSALHHAAMNRDCSTELVQALLNSGLSPTLLAKSDYTRELYHYMAPTSPLDLAVVAGNMDKLKVLVAAMDTSIEEHENIIVKAGNQADAQNRREMTDFLFSSVDRHLLDYETYLRNFEKQLEELRKSKQKKADITSADLGKIMPRISSRSGKLPKSGSIAVITSETLKNEAFMLVSALSSHEGITVVDRDEVDKSLQEQSLRSLANVDSKLLHQSLDLIPARHVVIMSQIFAEGDRYVTYSLIDSSSGVIKGLYSIPGKSSSDTEDIKELTKTLLADTTRLSESHAAISSTLILTEDNSSEANQIASICNSALPYLISSTTGCLHLSRNQFQHLEKEKAIGVDGSYWQAAWVIDGGISPFRDDVASIKLRATNPVNGNEIIATRQTSVDDARNSIRECWNEIADKIQPQPTIESSDKPTKEPKLLIKYAEWLHKTAHYDAALELMDAARALGDTSRLTLQLSIEAIQKKHNMGDRPYMRFSTNREYGFFGRYGVPLYSTPRAAWHLAKVKELNDINAYHKLCDTAIEYVDVIPKLKRHRNFDYDRHINETIEQLCIFRSISDSAIVSKYSSKSDAYTSLDSKIKILTTKYLERINSDNSKGDKERLDAHIGTIMQVLEKDHGYYAKFHPELFEALVGTIIENFDEFTGITKKHESVIRLASFRAFSAYQRHRDSESKVWLQLINKIGDSDDPDVVAFRDYSLINFNKNRNDRVNALKSMYYLAKLRTSQTGRKPPHHHMHLLCLDEPESDFKKIPYNIMEVALLDDYKGIDKTQEMIRLYGIYSWSIRLQTMRTADLVFLLKRTAEKNFGAYQTPTSDSEIWAKYRTMLLESRVLDETQKRLLDQIAEITPENQPEMVIDLKKQSSDVIIMPAQTGHPDRVFWVAEGRESQIENEIWMPGMYMGEKRLKNLGAYQSDNDNAIQVVSTDSHEIKTILLPRATKEHRGEEYLQHRGGIPTDIDNIRVKFGKQYAYYTPDSEHLFSINRETHEVKEIKLPYPQIEAVSDNVVNDTFYVYVQSGYGQRPIARQLVKVVDDQIEEVVVSNMRKPALTPMDQPDYVITNITVSNKSLNCYGRLDKKSGRQYFGYSKEVDSDSWKALSEYASHRENERAYSEIKLQGLHPCRIHGKDIRWIPFEKTLNACVSNRITNGHMKNVNKSLPGDTINSSHLKQFKVIPSPYQHPMLDKMLTLKKAIPNGDTTGMTNLATPGYIREIFGVWLSSNDLIREQLYKPTIIASSSDSYFVTLTSDGDSRVSNATIPAIWVIPKADINDKLKSWINDFYDMVAFRYEKHGPLTELKSTDLNIIADEGHAGIKKVKFATYLCIHGGNHELSINLSRPTSSKKQFSFGCVKEKPNSDVDFKIYAEHNGEATEIFNSNGHPISTDKKIPFTIISANIPKGCSKLRIVNNAPKNNGICFASFFVHDPL